MLGMVVERVGDGRVVVVRDVLRRLDVGVID